MAAAACVSMTTGMPPPPRPLALTLGGDDLAGDGAGEAHREVADVDELLHLAQALHHGVEWVGGKQKAR